MLKIANVKILLFSGWEKNFIVYVYATFSLSIHLFLCLCMYVHVWTHVQCTWTYVIQSCSSGVIHIVGFQILFVLRQALSPETVWSPIRLEWLASELQESVCLPPECCYSKHTPFLAFLIGSGDQTQILIYFWFMCMCVCLRHVYALQAWCPQRPEKAFRYPGSRVTGAYESPCG